MQTKTQELKSAIEKWRKAATASGNEEYKATCERTARALELELETGVAHCNCHLVPWEKCPFHSQRPRV